MGLAEELCCTIMDVGYCTKKNNAPKSRTKTIDDIILHSLEESRSDNDSMKGSLLES